MNISRNAPCPCGSGKKYKRCCAESDGERACGSCTGCCDGWLRIEVDGQAVYPGNPCPHSTGEGCRIYEHRPEDPCRQFLCGWRMASSPYPDWFAPEAVGCLMLPGKLRWKSLPVDVAVPVGEGITPKALAWLKRHAEQQMRPLLYQEGVDGKWAAHGPPAFQLAIRETLRRQGRLW